MGTRPNRLRILRTLLAAGALAVTCACGGGGGGSTSSGPPPVQPPPPPDTPGTLTGELDLFIPDQETVLEVEPNDDQLQTHFLGELLPGRDIDLIGHAQAGAAADDVDAFRVLAPERVEIEVTLEYEGPGAPRLGFGVWDFLGQQYVELHETAAGAIGTTLTLKGVISFVVYAVEGEADYVLRLRTVAAPAQIVEREPNDEWYAGNYLGELDLYDTVSVRGEGDEFRDEWDSVTIVCPTAIELETIASIPPTGFPITGEYDILVYDLTGGEAEPPLLAEFRWGDDGVDWARGRLDVAAGSLLQVFVHAWTGNDRWVLTLRTHPPTAGATMTTVIARADDPPVARRGGLRPPDFGSLPDSVVPGRVVLQGAGDAAAYARAAARKGCVVDAGEPDRVLGVRVPLPAGLGEDRARRATLRAVHALWRSGDVDWAEPVFLRKPLREPDDEFYGLQWHYELIGLPNAWDVTTGDDSIIVAVIDTGSSSHSDLQGRWVAGYDFISDADNALDGDGRDSDPTDPGDRAYGSSSSFHGTHVAGTIAARTNNGEGVAGINWQGKVMPLRVLGLYGGTSVDIAEAIRFAAGLPNASGTVPAQRANVINMSLGGPGFSNTTADAIAAARAAGVVVFASSGNAGTTDPLYPAAYDGVISVGAVGPNATRAYYSSYGSTLDLVAPGGDMRADRDADGYVDGVLSTMMFDDQTPTEAWYAFYQGTSMACPHAAGVAALMYAVEPTLTPDQVEQILTGTAEDLGPTGRDDEYGAGLIDPLAAVLAARAVVEPPAPPKLSLATTAVMLEEGETSARIRVRNVGGSKLLVESLEVVTQAPAPWLFATRALSASDSTDTSAIDLAVDREGLADGVYFGRVRVTSNGGTTDIQVLLRVESVPPGPPNVDVYVRAVNVQTGEIARQIIVNPLTGLAFALDGLAPGRYRLEAGTDPNNNGKLFEVGELGGVYPLESAPILIDLAAGEERGPFRFTVKPSGILPD